MHVQCVCVKSIAEERRIIDKYQREKSEVWLQRILYITTTGKLNASRAFFFPYFLLPRFRLVFSRKLLIKFSTAYYIMCIIYLQDTIYYNIGGTRVVYRSGCPTRLRPNRRHCAHFPHTRAHTLHNRWCEVFVCTGTLSTRAHFPPRTSCRWRFFRTFEQYYASRAGRLSPEVECTLYSIIIIIIISHCARRTAAAMVEATKCAAGDVVVHARFAARGHDDCVLALSKGFSLVTNFRFTR